MDPLTKEQFDELLLPAKGICFSLFIPIVRSTALVKQNTVRLKKLLSTAEQELINNGLSVSKAKKFLEPAHDFAFDEFTLQPECEGLAIFLSQDLFRHYYLPRSVAEFAFVGTRFHVTPLLPFLVEDGLYYVLALSQKKIRVLRCTRFTVEEVTVKGIPENLEAAMVYKDPERQLQYHTQTPRYPDARGAAIFHGHGVGIDDQKIDLEEYFRQIDIALHPVIKVEKAPLILASVDYLLPLYQKITSYPHLIGECIPGNPELLSDHELRDKGWALVQAYFERDVRMTREKYSLSTGTSRSSSTLKEVCTAAYQGKVESLFVNIHRQIWGVYNPETGKLLVHEKKEPGDDDLLNAAAIETLSRRGKVYPTKPSDQLELFAVFRY